MKKLYNLQINETIKKIIPPLSSEELRILENNIIRDGCREPICVWNNTIVDGHNRYGICTKHKIPFDIQEMEFNSFEEMEDWVCVNQLGRRNISEDKGIQIWCSDGIVLYARKLCSAGTYDEDRKGECRTGKEFRDAICCSS